MCDLAIKGDHIQVLKVKYFSARVKASKSDLSKPERQMAYWRALETISDFEIIEGCYKKRTVKGKLTESLSQEIRKGKVVRVEKYEEKESDVNIAAQILRDSALKEIDCIILLSNDTDLKMPLRIARKDFQKKIGIISPLNIRMHFALKEVSNFQRKITEDMLKQCQFPTKIRSDIVKPEGW